MKIVADTRSFVDAVNWVTKGYDTKSSSSFVALVATENEASLQYTSPTSLQKSNFTAPIIEFNKTKKSELKIALDGQFLQRLSGVLKNNKSETIEITYEKGKSANPSLSIKTNDATFSVPMFAKRVGEIPQLTELGEVDEQEFFNILQRMSKLCDPATGIGVVGSVDVRLDIENKQIHFMGTDRYVLGVMSCSFDPSSEAADFVTKNPELLIPQASAAQIAPPKGLGSSVTLVYDPESEKFGYVFADSRIALFALTDAEAIPYPKLQESSLRGLEYEFTVSTGEFRKAIATLTSIAQDSTNVILLVSENGLLITDETSENSIRLDVENVVTGLEDGEEERIVFNATVIGSVFVPIPSPKMKMRWVQPNRPLVVDSVLDDGSSSTDIFVSVASVKEKA